ncbi:MAG: transglutaminase family protein [Roseofilum sp. SBFL]|uniref:transglutaminase family protein n=1 Tax=unclassified Roseofilum TaxID=2620099 RepID=UPI001B212B6A|nr:MULTISPECIES: transglutaminase family protein [unclassified Roseofilum]MBP0011969.1 transglutaminase family protein [Roseofilum sp. SID3]MBP0022970.1 transglutaminase family protein [Roseofilum sp. SID2]MBP0037467.1 transglutaminase family protein [Roseofilum sp. SID1]MBP0044744.1 transglutaminase family protein [Roseofilum sp. SBFL]
MRYKIIHSTYYTYSEFVALSPHWLRLRSRSDGAQTLHHFQLEIDPLPTGQSSVLDEEGNVLEKIWFDAQELKALKITATSEVETHCSNPFNYLLEPWAVQFPIDYPSSLLARLSPYFAPRTLPSPIDPRVYTWAMDIADRVRYQVTPFLSAINQQIYERCDYYIRDTGDPFPPGITWEQKGGTCRDYAVLFMEACRAMGLAARFVSGYQEGDRDTPDRHLHAWAEVYLPGAGWRGYDPTHGLAVSNGHIAVAASAIPQNTAPVSGTLRRSQVHSQMDFDLAIACLD